ncbi:hypothetical protein UPYG_G00307240 [Umbra pygmaea]|uniref:Ashwin n=1 Tax=Umbra pygmaea TaxID=75934 RepID=A0ABD0W3I1_UMBPY
MQRARAGQSGAGGQRYSSSNDHNSKRPPIVFDGSSSRSGPVRLKTTEGQTSGSGVTDRLKPPPSSSLSNPIRKLSNTTLISTCSSPIPGGFHGSPTGNKGQKSPSSPTSVNLKREADTLGSLKSPEVKKKIQKVTWP